MKVSFLSMIRGLLVLLLLELTPADSDRAGTGLKPDRGGSAISTLVDKRPVGGGEVSEYLGILCLDTSGEVLGLGLEMSSRPGWGLGLRSSAGFVLG